MEKYIKYFNIRIIVTGVLALALLESCDDFVDGSLPDNQITTKDIFTTESTLRAAMRGVYVTAGTQSYGSGTMVNAALFADELHYALTGSSKVAQDNSYSPVDDFGMMTYYYSVVYRANVLLEGIDKSTVSQSLKDEVKGQCLFLRAYSYFNLVNFYGTAPLVLTSNPKISVSQSNTLVATTYQQIISDLETARDLLAEDYPTDPGAQGNFRTTVNKQTVNTLLAKAYLYTQNWDKAISIATTVINSGLYTITPTNKLGSIANKANNETIWQAWDYDGITLGGALIPVNTNSFNYSVSPQLVADLAADTLAGDKRFKAWLKPGTGAKAGKFIAFKYKSNSASQGDEYLIYFRLSELYLIRAEAVGQSTAGTLASGILDLDVIRKHAGLPVPSIGITDKTALLNAVASERRKELSFECANRWFDLKRTGKAVEVLNPIKVSGFEEYRTLLPFPQTSIDANLNLVQNPKY